MGGRKSLRSCNAAEAGSDDAVAALTEVRVEVRVRRKEVTMVIEARSRNSEGGGGGVGVQSGIAASALHNE